MELCSICRKNKAPFSCGCCQTTICKSCTQFLDEAQFSFLTEMPQELTYENYCNPCYDSKVLPKLEAYSEILERAKNINVFFKKQSKETRTVRRLEAPLKIKDCPDYDETLLRLAFLAAQSNFNSLVDVDINSEKVRNGSYQTSKWHGTGVPASIEAQDLAKMTMSPANPY